MKSILTLLSKDHREVEELFKELEKNEDLTPKKKEKLFDELYIKLDAHATAEEEVVYVPLVTEKKIEDKTKEAYEEHHVVRILLKELGAIKATDDQWKAKLQVLKENVEHHVKEEESDLYDFIKQKYETSELQAMGERFELRKEELIKEQVSRAS